MRIIILILIVLMAPLLALAEIPVSAEEALKRIFPSAREHKIQGRIFAGQPVKVFHVFAEGKAIGWAVMLDEIGKTEPITFLVGIDKEMKVAGIDVLELRDMRGAGIKRRSFLRQFQNMSLQDKIAVGKDIDAVSGATMSSYAAAQAVRKALAVAKEAQGAQ